MINGNFPLPDETVAAMRTIRSDASVLAGLLLSSARAAGTYDTGRLIAALDLLQQVKNVAIDALILPHAPPS
jgi:hypothetical protein